MASLTKVPLKLTCGDSGNSARLSPAVITREAWAR